MAPGGVQTRPVVTVVEPLDTTVAIGKVVMLV
jgi:hypothetical protein